MKKKPQKAKFNDPQCSESYFILLLSILEKVNYHSIPAEFRVVSPQLRVPLFIQEYLTTKLRFLYSKQHVHRLRGGSRSTYR